jgi:soluble lytic murein transglycosylase-like protein
VRRATLAVILLALVFPAGASTASQPGPPPKTPIPREPARLAATLIRTTGALRAALADWRPALPPPLDVTLPALYQQRIERLLSRDERLARAVLSRLPSTLADHVRDDVTAHRGLSRLTPPLHIESIRIAIAAPATRLRAYYGEAQRRFGVPWSVLAAVNFVESDFGRIRSASAAGAQGPMQFLPSTWRRYGLGGDLHDPHDAILGAANFLRSAGARRDLPRALYAYNPSRAYVDAVRRYARWIGRDRLAFLTYYSWQLFAKTTRGERRLTGPGLR